MARKKYTDFERRIIKNNAINLKKILKRKNITQKELSDKTGIPTSTMSEYVNGNTLISLGNLHVIADVLNIKKSDIDPHILNLNDDADMVNLPIYGNIPCGKANIIDEQIEGYETTPKTWLNGGDYFYFRAKGDSMVGARIYDGDLLLIRRQSTVNDGEIAAVVIEDQAIIKRIYFRDETLILQSENPNYPPIIYKQGDIRIEGKLKKIIINV